MQIVFYNKKCGNIHFTIEEMLQEAIELYDIYNLPKNMSLGDFYAVMFI